MENRDLLLQGWLQDHRPVAVAVSGGVDSLTLATAVHRWGSGAMFHAVSPAVPPEATQRVRCVSREQGWDLRIFDAGEFENPTYLENPVNRCFYCKQSLYTEMRRQTSWLIVSGTNLDDLGEYRPGLTAAQDAGARHPYVETGLNKAAVRDLSRRFGLGAIAELPAAPCLASRVETGIRVDPVTLRAVHEIETSVADMLGVGVVRCRVRANAIGIELEQATLDQLAPATVDQIEREVRRVFGGSLAERPVILGRYRTGSAFLVAAK